MSRPSIPILALLGTMVCVRGLCALARSALSLQLSCRVKSTVEAIAMLTGWEARDSPCHDKRKREDAVRVAWFSAATVGIGCGTAVHIWKGLSFVTSRLSILLRSLRTYIEAGEVDSFTPMRLFA
ncbi:uncharacterized protein PHACADRAFT_184908 [Phanerochaete carnosa HHB-10118-sp]|uniref:Secreted protein n=1 Tax=Phanerochaete carnosa (strain HHB-10118-sp) TaxID=650164 RepID=K5UV55_PHACS|nr:uncharacterized protein PHACADRAFT_184908 [Phanerochaete carnosa HHB-10118-sp]EKM53866.1 hypothetical protein PHACADRAFT_184908 [Phanerochaete carnosa HHB-10118-sp]